MPESPSPRLRTDNKVKPPYYLNQFPSNFGFKLGEEIIYLLATKGKAVLEGPEWEEIFASCIGAKWKPSNVGLDDIVLDSCAWGAKTVKARNPASWKIVRLISGRNSPIYSFNKSFTFNDDPNIMGERIISIWNERVAAIRKIHKHLRTIVLIKSYDLSEVVVFEFETVRYAPELYVWKWNKNNNLVGCSKFEKHCFTWQPHGSQFTILEEVPEEALIIKVRLPPKLDKKVLLNGIGFNKEWIEVTKKNV